MSKLTSEMESTHVIGPTNQKVDGLERVSPQTSG